MRVDTNTSGHHQWFNFSCENPSNYQGKTVTFTIKNFTKDESLYTSGMRVAISKKSQGYKYFKGGENITYKQSALIRRKHIDPTRSKYFYELKFNFTFGMTDDKVYFSYCFPYTFSHL
jgi:hypothetical protein